MATKDELKAMFSDGMKPTGDDFAELIDGVEGPQGPAGKDGTDGSQGEPGADGKDGEQGPQGEPGADGADGFGSEAQYDEIIGRLEALEKELIEEN